LLFAVHINTIDSCCGISGNFFVVIYVLLRLKVQWHVSSIIVRLSSVLVYKFHTCRRLYVLRDCSVISTFEHGLGGRGSFLSEVIFLITVSIVPLKVIKFHLILNKLDLSIYFLSSLIHI
jgi:hypothetical protein